MFGKKLVVYFNQIPIKPIQGKAKYNIYNVAEGNKSIVAEEFQALDDETKVKIKALIMNMATIDNFKSPQIRYNLRGYNYGEIRPKPHRFFFFQKCGNNFIFFYYILKKTNTLSDKIYKSINIKKEKYEKEFEEFIKGLQ